MAARTPVAPLTPGEIGAVWGADGSEYKFRLSRCPGRNEGNSNPPALPPVGPRSHAGVCPCTRSETADIGRGGLDHRRPACVRASSRQFAATADPKPVVPFKAPPQSAPSRSLSWLPIRDSTSAFPSMHVRHAFDKVQFDVTRLIRDIYDRFHFSGHEYVTSSAPH